MTGLNAEATIALLITSLLTVASAATTQAPNRTGRPSVVTAIPADYREPAGGWTPRCSPDQTVCAFRAQRGAEMFVLVNGKPGAGYEDVGSIVFSTDGHHVAYVAKRQGSWMVVADGKEGQAFETIEGLTFIGARPFYLGDRRSRPREEADGVFRGTRRVEGFKNPGGEAGSQMIRDVMVGEHLDDIPVVAEERRGGIARLFVSPDETSYAYVAEVPGSSGPLWMLMLNGQEVTEDNGLDILSFTQDGRLAFRSRTGSLGEGRARVQVGETIVVNHTGDIMDGAVSADGRTLAYLGCAGGQPARRGSTNSSRVQNSMPAVKGHCALMFGGKAVREGEEGVIANVTLSPNGRTLAFTERQAGAPLHAVVGDREGPPVDALLGRLVFSADGTRHAYAAKIGADAVVVADGVAGPAFDSVDNIRFSDDSKHLAYTASKRGVHQVVLGQTAAPTGFAWVSPAQFDVDGKTLRFVAQEGRTFSRRSVAVGR